MVPDRYTINHRLLIKMQRGGHVFCAVCLKPIVEGQQVVWVKRETAIHKQCAVPFAKKRNAPISI